MANEKDGTTMTQTNSNINHQHTQGQSGQHKKIASSSSQVSNNFNNRGIKLTKPDDLRASSSSKKALENEEMIKVDGLTLPDGTVYTGQMKKTPQSKD